MGIKIDYLEKVNAGNLDTIYITGAGYINKAFKGVGRNSALGWSEVIWGSALTRSNTFALKSIDDISIGSVRQVELVFPLMNIDDFVALQKILHERHCEVTAFYVDDMEWHTCEMAVTNNERKKIYNYGSDVLGMMDVKVKFVATNRDLIENDVTIIYDANNGGEGYDIKKTYKTEQITLSSGSDFTKSGYRLLKWNTKKDGTGDSYSLSQSITVSKSMTLYAVWGV